MDIAQYIRELILSNECVILRGVGGFETSYKHASFKKNKNSLVPPNKHILFRPEMVKDNGVLENYIHQVTGIDLGQVAEKIDIFVADFFNTLRNNGKVVLEGVGEFTLTSDNKLIFHALEDVNYLADSFGLEPLEITVSPSDKKEVEKAELTPVSLEKRKLTGWYVTIGVLMLVIFITLIVLLSDASNTGILNYFSRSSDKDESSIIVFGPAPETKKDSVTLAIENTINEMTSPQKALAFDNRPVQKTEPVKQIHQTTGNDLPYLLIAGSFKNSRNAEIMKQHLLRKGFAPEVLYTGGDYYRVVIGKFSDRQSAIDELRRIRKQIDQSVWLWERN